MTKVLLLVTFCCLHFFLQVSATSAIDDGYKISRTLSSNSAILNNDETDACVTDEECQLGGYCNDGECECMGGLSGRNCEIIDECSQNPDMCGSDPNAKCSIQTQGYHHNYFRAICRCKTKGKRFDMQTKTCVDQKSCENHKQCKNGGLCRGSKQGPKYCNCRYGTSGDFCERVDECVANPDYCGRESGAECRFNTYIDRIYCQCMDPNQRFDWPQKKCVNRTSCRANDECLPFGVCHNKCTSYEACLDYDHVEKIRSCHCVEGTSGENCEIIDDCQNGIVDCGTSDNVACDYLYNRGISAHAYCKCKDSKQEFDRDEKVCKDCDCGPLTRPYYTYPCSFANGKKTCDCAVGTYFDGDRCTDCKCGEGVKRCRLENNRVQCVCKKGFVLKDEKCQKE